MIFLDEIPHLKNYKLKTFLPTERTNKLVGSCILLNTSSVESNIELMSHKMFDNSKFNSFYMDFMYQGRIRTKAYRENRKAERLQVYDKVKTTIITRPIRTFTTAASVNNRNLYYDLHVYNELFFTYTESLEYKKKVKLYLEFMKSYFDNESISNYSMKTMFINVNEWDKDVNAKLGAKNFNNPVLIIYYAMRKMFQDFKALGDMNIVFVFSSNVIRLNPS